MVRHCDERGLAVSALSSALGGDPGYKPTSPKREERVANLSV
jgi:hypothetical protein